MKVKATGAQTGEIWDSIWRQTNIYKDDKTKIQTGAS